MTTPLPVLKINTLLIASGLFLAAPVLAEPDNGTGAGPTETQQSLIETRKEEIAMREASLGLAKAKLTALKEKLKSQENFISDLNGAIERKQNESVKSATATPEAGKRTLPTTFLADVTPRIVIVEGNQGNGTGFLCTIGADVWVYTAAHVLSGNTKITVRDSKGRVYRDFDFLECAEGVDLVRLKLKDPDMKGLDLVPSSDAPEVGDLIVAVGNSLGTGSLSGEPGRILSVKDDMWEVDAEIIPGNSGGPILSLDSGKVVGIVTHLIISKGRSQSRPNGETKVARFAARLDKEWEWRKMPVTRFVKEWQHIETMDRNSSIAWASNYLMHTGPEAVAKMDPRYRTTSRTDPETVRIAESILTRERNHFQVQRVDEWLKRYRDASPLARNELIVEGNKIIDRNIEEIRIKPTDPKAEDFSWFHRKMFEEEIKWRNKLTGD